MGPVDLASLEQMFERADEVVRLDQYRYRGDRSRVIGLRHDVDTRGWPSALAMARWEAARGYSSTWYFLHTAPYWPTPEFQAALPEFIDLGHEVGLHNNCLSVWYESKGFVDPFELLHHTLGSLREWSGAPVISTAGHGDDLCYVGKFVNYAMFEECPPTPPWKAPLRPRPLSDFGLEFAGDWVPREIYLSDTGDQWSEPIDDIVAEFPFAGGTVVLQHPDWYPAGLFS